MTVRSRRCGAARLRANFIAKAAGKKCDKTFGDSRRVRWHKGRSVQYAGATDRNNRIPILLLMRSARQMNLRDAIDTQSHVSSGSGKWRFLLKRNSCDVEPTNA
jgi:hypothetical protein